MMFKKFLWMTRAAIAIKLLDWAHWLLGPGSYRGITEFAAARMVICTGLRDRAQADIKQREALKK